jgi:hypothetical protein
MASYSYEQSQSNLQNAYKAKDYGRLNYYNSSLGVPVNPGPYPVGMSIIPSFDGVSYINPNYNSLVSGNYCTNNYPTVTDGYMDKPNNCVKYNTVQRPCSPNAKTVFGPIKPGMYYSESYQESNPNLKARPSPYTHDSSCSCSP